MVESRFVTYSELEAYFINGNINSIKNQLSDAILIGSTSDMLYIIEQFQKNNIQISLQQLNANFELLCNEGSFYFPELDRDKLLKNLFIDEDILWDKPCNNKISPRFSLSLLTIIPNDYCFWSKDVFEQMESFYLSFESYV